MRVYCSGEFFVADIPQDVREAVVARESKRGSLTASEGFKALRGSLGAVTVDGENIDLAALPGELETAIFSSRSVSVADAYEEVPLAMGDPLRISCRLDGASRSVAEPTLGPPTRAIWLQLDERIEPSSGGDSPQRTPEMHAFISHGGTPIDTGGPVNIEVETSEFVSTLSVRTYDSRAAIEGFYGCWVQPYSQSGHLLLGFGVTVVDFDVEFHTVTTHSIMAVAAIAVLAAVVALLVIFFLMCTEDDPLGMGGEARRWLRGAKMSREQQVALLLRDIRSPQGRMILGSAEEVRRSEKRVLQAQKTNIDSALESDGRETRVRKRRRKPLLVDYSTTSAGETDFRIKKLVHYHRVHSGSDLLGKTSSMKSPGELTLSKTSSMDERELLLQPSEISRRRRPQQKPSFGTTTSSDESLVDESTPLTRFNANEIPPSLRLDDRTAAETDLLTSVKDTSKSHSSTASRTQSTTRSASSAPSKSRTSLQSKTEVPSKTSGTTNTRSSAGSTSRTKSYEGSSGSKKSGTSKHDAVGYGGHDFVYDQRMGSVPRSSLGSVSVSSRLQEVPTINETSKFLSDTERKTTESSNSREKEFLPNSSTDDRSSICCRSPVGSDVEELELSDGREAEYIEEDEDEVQDSLHQQTFLPPGQNSAYGKFTDVSKQGSFRGRPPEMSKQVRPLGGLRDVSYEISPKGSSFERPSEVSKQVSFRDRTSEISMHDGVYEQPSEISKQGSSFERSSQIPRLGGTFEGPSELSRHDRVLGRTSKMRVHDSAYEITPNIPIEASERKSDSPLSVSLSGAVVDEKTASFKNIRVISKPPPSTETEDNVTRSRLPTLQEGPSQYSILRRDDLLEEDYDEMYDDQELRSAPLPQSHLTTPEELTTTRVRRTVIEKGKSSSDVQVKVRGKGARKVIPQIINVGSPQIPCLLRNEPREPAKERISNTSDLSQNQSSSSELGSLHLPTVMYVMQDDIHSGQSTPVPDSPKSISTMPLPPVPHTFFGQGTFSTDGPLRLAAPPLLQQQRGSVSLRCGCGPPLRPSAKWRGSSLERIPEDCGAETCEHVQNEETHPMMKQLMGMEGNQPEQDESRVLQTNQTCEDRKEDSEIRKRDAGTNPATMCFTVPAPVNNANRMIPKPSPPPPPPPPPPRPPPPQARCVQEETQYIEEEIMSRNYLEPHEFEPNRADRRMLHNYYDDGGGNSFHSQEIEIIDNAANNRVYDFVPQILGRKDASDGARLRAGLDEQGSYVTPENMRFFERPMNEDDENPLENSGYNRLEQSSHIIMRKTKGDSFTLTSEDMMRDWKTKAHNYWVAAAHLHGNPTFNKLYRATQRLSAANKSCGDNLPATNDIRKAKAITFRRNEQENATGVRSEARNSFTKLWDSATSKRPIIPPAIMTSAGNVNKSQPTRRRPHSPRKERAAMMKQAIAKASKSLPFVPGHRSEMIFEPKKSVTFAKQLHEKEVQIEPKETEFNIALSGAQYFKSSGACSKNLERHNLPQAKISEHLLDIEATAKEIREAGC